MSIYSYVTEEDMVNLAKKAEQHNKEITEKMKNSLLNQTHNKKLAESFKPITKKLEEVNKSTLQDVFKKTRQLAIENTQRAIGKNQNQSGVV